MISLLSGHLGGANALTLEVAELLGAQFRVVTTATDLHHRFAVDVFAKKNCCGIQNMKAAKEVSAALLAGEPVGFYSEFPLDRKVCRKAWTECCAEGHPVRWRNCPGDWNCSNHSSNL